MIALIRGLRGFRKELSRTGSLRALWLQVRTGAVHVVRALRGRENGDPIPLFLANYGADGMRLPDVGLATLQFAAQRCIACGLCSLECARITTPRGPAAVPRHDPLQAVACASRLAIDIVRLGPALAGPEAGPSPCTGCAACDAVCPVEIPIARLQDALGRLEAEAARSGSVPMAMTPGMR